MANKKINELVTRTPSLSDLILVGDPSSGYSYKATVTALATIIETDIADGFVTISTTQTISGAKTFSNNLTLTSVANAATTQTKFLTLNGSNVVNYRTGAEVLADIGAASSSNISGTTNYIAKFTSSSAIGNSVIYESGGNIGIGTTTLTARLTVNGNAILSGSINATETYLSSPNGLVFQINSTNVSGGYAEFQTNSTTIGKIGTATQVVGSGGTSVFAISSTGANDFILGTNGTQRVRIDTSGNVTFSQIANATIDTDKFLVSDSGVLKYRTGAEVLSDIGGASSSSISGTTNYIPKFTSSSAIGNSVIYESSSNIGIGTSSPTAKLDVVGSSGIRVNEDGAGTKVITIRSNYAGVDPAINVVTDNSLLFMTNNTERMRLTSTGLGIGTSSPAYKLAVNGAIASTSGDFYATDGTRTNFFGIYTGSNLGVLGMTTNHDLRIITNNTQRLLISSTGAATFSSSVTATGIASLGIGETTALAYIGDRTTVNTRYIKFARASALTDIVNIQGVNGGVGTADISLQAEGSNVGIGTTSPTFKLDVQDATTAATRILHTTSNNSLILQAGSGSAMKITGYNYVTSTAVPVYISVDGANTILQSGGGNVGISTTSPALKLDVVSASQWDGIRVYNATASQGADIRVGNDVNNNLGFLRVGGSTSGGNNQNTLMVGTGGGYDIHIAPNGTPAITAKNGGNVGISNTSPTYKLDVSGTGRFTSNLTIQGNDLDLNNGTVLHRITNDNTNLLIRADYGNASANSTIQFSIDGTERMRISSTGYVSTNGNTASQNPPYLQGISFGWNKSNGQGESMINWTNAGGGTNPDITFNYWNNTTFSERMRITSSGNVGIGTTSPATTLHVAKDNGAITLTRGAGTYGTKIVQSNSDGSINFQIGLATAGSWRTYMRLGEGESDPSLLLQPNGGNVGIGTTSPNSILQIKGALNIERSNTTDYSIIDNEGNLNLKAATGGGGGSFNMTFATAGSERMRITSGGEVYIAGTTDQGAYNLQVNGTGVWGAGAYVNGSDIALKQNILPLDNSLELVKKMKPVTYTYKESYSTDDSIQTGFIAQDLQELLKDKNYLNGIVKQGPEYLNVAYQNLIPLLVKAIQEQQIEIENLKNK